jgi:hypothetical protein
VGLRDVSSVFSRYFTVGFFLPSFFTLVVLTRLVSDNFLPATYTQASGQTQILLVGGAALLLGLLLSGFSDVLMDAFCGYAGFRPLTRLLHARKLRQFDSLQARRAQGDDQAALQFATQFAVRREHLLPTRFGNVFQAAEDYAYDRWGLESGAVWPNIAALLSDRERELHADANTELFLLVNFVIGASLVGAILVADAIVNSPLGLAWTWLYLIPFLTAHFFYLASVRSARRAGLQMQTSMTLHRLEFYEKLGLRHPTSIDDERNMALALNQFLLGIPCPELLERFVEIGQQYCCGRELMNDRAGIVAGLEIPRRYSNSIDPGICGHRSLRSRAMPALAV